MSAGNKPLDPCEGSSQRVPVASVPKLAGSPFESYVAQVIHAAFADGWGSCRDAEFAGDEAMNDAFNQSATLGVCLSIDQRATTPVGAGGAGVMDARPDSVHSDSGECGEVHAPPPTDAEQIGGKDIESWYCYGMPSDPLTPEQRAEVIDYARTFEECGYSREELADMDDVGIISAAYAAMADYARGQM